MRRSLAMLAFFSIAALSIDYRTLLGMRVSPSPDRNWPEYPEFLEEVRNSTRPGDSIALIVPARRGTNDYDYAFFRASYFLAGREVLPLIDAQGRVARENVDKARFVAVWHGRMQSNRPVVWRGRGGELLGR